MTEKNPEAADAQPGSAAGEKDGAQERPGRSFHDFHMLLFRAFHAQRNLLSPYVKRLGLGNGQPKILSYLAVKGPSTQRDLAEFYEIDAAAVSRMLDALERSGFITATASATDRRSKTIALTEQGMAAVNAWDAVCVEEENAMLEGFSDTERAALADYLDRVHRNLRAYGSKLAAERSESAKRGDAR